MPPDAASDTKPEIAHVLTMDVVGYSKRLIDEQTTLMAELNEVVRQSTRFRVADTAGKLIRLPTGDGVALVFFDEPQAAMECATEIATALIAHPRIQLRMGLHSGPVNRVVDLAGQPNVAGAGIDLAQRVMDCGDAGHILLSKRIAYDLAPLPRWNAQLHELGSVAVKHGQQLDLVNFYNAEIGNPELPTKLKRAREEVTRAEERLAWRRRGIIAAVALLLLGAIVFGFRKYRRAFAEPIASQTVPERSIAVLPFVDLSQTHDQEYFCDGVSEEILDTLAKVDGLRVVARTSAFAFKGKNVDVSEIGRKLNVATVLEGSLRRDGNRIRVTAQLVNAQNGFHLWSDTIENEMAGVFEMQDKITRSIVDALKIRLASASAAPAPQNTEAYDLYLQGLALSNKSTEDELRRSLDLFKRALERDPKLSRAWSGIAKDWFWLADAYVRPRDAYPQVELAARKALALDERDADAHVYLGETKRVMSFDLKGEIAEIERALAIDPNSSSAHLYIAAIRTAFDGDRKGGLEEMHRAVQLDPLSPIIGSFEVQFDVANNRLDEAFAAAKRTMDIDPSYVYFEPNLALVYREQGKLKEALEIYERVEQTHKQPSAGLAITYARLNRGDDARRVLNQLINIANSRYFPADQVASVFVALRDNESALRWLDRAIEERSGPIHAIAYMPEFRPLRSDPRFAEVLRRIGVDPAKVLDADRAAAGPGRLSSTKAIALIPGAR